MPRGKNGGGGVGDNEAGEYVGKTNSSFLAFRADFLKRRRDNVHVSSKADMVRGMRRVAQSVIGCVFPDTF